MKVHRSKTAKALMVSSWVIRTRESKVGTPLENSGRGRQVIPETRPTFYGDYHNKAENESLVEIVKGSVPWFLATNYVSLGPPIQGEMTLVCASRDQFQSRVPTIFLIPVASGNKTKERISINRV